ncbi:MAG: hypothetical protein KF741_11375 [Ferruginibacter sp.]|nr:hypothetical protein [Bacteroidota bacterium]MBX2919834.1 hypothetical protein [Ferruginibacter sp.]
MNTKHLTDEAIQDYVLQETTDSEISRHISVCTECKSKVEVYRTLMNTMYSIKPEVFPFDVTEVVSQRIEVKTYKRKTLGSYALGLVLSIVILSVVLYSLSILKPVLQVFHSLKMIDNAFILVSAICICVFLLKDITRQYKEKEMLLLQ